MGEKQDDIILKVDHLTKTFQVKSPRLFEKPLALNAVNDVSFEVKRGENIGVIGESGCGNIGESKSSIDPGNFRGCDL